ESVDTLRNTTNLKKADTLGGAAKSNNDTAIFKDTTSFNISPNVFHYTNVRYYHIYPGCCPYYIDAIVKEKQDIEESRVAVGETSTITLDILLDMYKGFKQIKHFTSSCDKVTLYPHYIECITYYRIYKDTDVWDHIALYKYDDFSKPFLSSDEQYWYFNMNPRSDHMSKNCLFITRKNSPSSNMFELILSDMNGMLQEVKIKAKVKKDSKTDFTISPPDIKFISENPYQYSYEAGAHSEKCNTIYVDPKDDYSDLRKHITKSKFKLVFNDAQNKKDSLIIPIEDGLFYGESDKQFDVSIFQ
ncbi:MAG TPA: hypothetical protein VN922_05825, partial [Bacteroidia bacterium]|nr:hypothetical protein [Bacteroidia bacterium]